MEKGVDFAALLQESREEEDGDLKSSGARKKPEDLLEATLSPSEQRKGGDKMDAGDEEKKGEKDEADGKLVEEEEHITGQVDVSVYKNYLLSVGSVVLIVLLLVLAVTFEAGDLAQVGYKFLIPVIHPFDLYFAFSGSGCRFGAMGQLTLTPASPSTSASI